MGELASESLLLLLILKTRHLSTLAELSSGEPLAAFLHRGGRACLFNQSRRLLLRCRRCQCHGRNRIFLSEQLSDDVKDPEALSLGSVGLDELLDPPRHLDALLEGLVVVLLHHMGSVVRTELGVEDLGEVDLGDVGKHKVGWKLKRSNKSW